jgi:hypothetical protein
MGADAVFISYSHDSPDHQERLLRVGKTALSPQARLLPRRVPRGTAAPTSVNGAR